MTLTKQLKLHFNVIYDFRLCHGLWSPHYAVRSRRAQMSDRSRGTRSMFDIIRLPTRFPPGKRRGCALRLAARDRPSAACWHTSCSSCNNPGTAERRATTQHPAIHFSLGAAPEKFAGQYVLTETKSDGSPVDSLRASQFCSSVRCFPMALIFN